MRRITLVASLALSLIGTSSVSFAAQHKSIRQLPDDVVRWSTAWLIIPEQMYEVAKTDGPIAALTWGPAKGTAVMVHSTVKGLWEAAKPDSRPVRRAQRPNEPRGVMLRYEF